MKYTSLATTSESSISRDVAARWKKLKYFAALLLVSSLILFSILFSKLIDPQDSIPEKNLDKLLGGLLVDGIDESSCQSRYQSNLHRRTRPRQPSSYLISRLRNYEALQKKCGSNTDAYNKTVEILKSNGQNTNNTTDCKYMIWTPFEGLGNRMLSLASTFLYALLTNRVLLIGEGDTIPDLFCEPFPDISWLLPSDFPIGQLKNFDKFSHNSYGSLSRNISINKTPKMMPPYVYIHMVYDHDRTEKLSFCDQDQTFLHDIPFLIMKSNVYYAPALFSIPSFQQELHNLFPEKETVFHHLGRYLFHPSNSVWGLITRYYDAYLANADEQLGIQIRVFWWNSLPNLDQVLSCTMKENLLPGTINTEVPGTIKKSQKGKTKAVLITSLKSSFYEDIRKMYWKHATVTGENIAVYQPSHEEKQQTGNETHDRKALAEIYLLSMSDKLVTSARSTFGYVAQSLGGLRPWILYSPDHGRVPNPPCKQALSMEPCFQWAPLIYTCKNVKEIETNSLLPHLRECEDMLPDPSMKLFE